MKLYAVAYVASAVVFLALDAVWLSLSTSRLYRPSLSGLLLDDFRPVPAGLFYIIYVTGIVVFAVMPAAASGRWITASLLGGLFGLCAYATYDLSNRATLKDWPLFLTVIDLSWGTLLSAVAATVGYAAVRWMSAP